MVIAKDERERNQMKEQKQKKLNEYRELQRFQMI